MESMIPTCTAAHTVINLGEPKPGFHQLGALVASAVTIVRSYCNGDASGHDLVTDVPFSLPLEPYEHLAMLTRVSAAPAPDDPWGFFRYHHVQLYQQAIGALAAIPEILPGIDDLDIVGLIEGIYAYPDSPAVAWDHFDDGTDSDGICWGVKYLAGADAVIFRGSTTMEDWMRDFDCVARPFGDSRLGPVHPGFWLGMRQVIDELLPLRRPVPLIIGGHSLGSGRGSVCAGELAALATIEGKAE